MEIKDYAEIFRKALKEVGSEQAAIMIVQEIGKDIRQSLIPENKQKQKPADFPSQPATLKQIEVLKKHNLYKEGMTKQEAMRIISEAMESKKNA